ncbi:MAG: hypothetical protein KJO35_10725, partial [Gammaproteobacteria bacterium]|nr:hypothetical protein [Gammaproteobacteria bacterium]
MTSNDISKSRTTAVLAIFAMAIGVVAYYGVKYPIPNDSVSGTVAPAERFRGEQLSSDDVTLGNESMAQLMQTDLYQQMIDDPELALAFTDSKFLAAVSSPEMQALYKNQATIEAISSQQLHRV